MNIVKPEESQYLERASEHKMSYYREKSLKRAVSYRAVLVKKDGKLAQTQYIDQYLDKEMVMVSLKKQASRHFPSDNPQPDESMVSQALSKYILLVVSNITALS
jgi:hypothetical protein